MPGKTAEATLNLMGTGRRDPPSRKSSPAAGRLVTKHTLPVVSELVSYARVGSAVNAWN